MHNFIPTYLVPRLAREHGVDEKARTFTPWSHTASLMFAHLARAMGLNEVCDSLHLNRGMFSTIRAAVVPNRNTLSHANRERNPAMSEGRFSDVRITDRAVGFLEKRDKARPFFLFVNYHEPHSPSHLCDPYWQMFDAGKMPLPASFKLEPSKRRKPPV